jgi:tetratricopeptide (TPR) repeat protein
MSGLTHFLDDRSFDNLLLDLDSLKQYPELLDTINTYLAGDYRAILRSPTSQTLFEKLSHIVLHSREQQDAVLQKLSLDGDLDAVLVLITGLAAMNAFLQANVTGPPIAFGGTFPAEKDGALFKSQCIQSLDVDGLSVYQHIPHVELFCMARMIFTVYFPRIIDGKFRDCKWMRVRINAYHQRLLSGLSEGRLDGSDSLQDVMERDLKDLEHDVLGSESKYSTEAKVRFLLEKAQIYVMQGLDLKARENVKMARTLSGFSYVLSGALGKRTKFQQTSISQLVVFAKSKDPEVRSQEGLPGKLSENRILKGKHDDKSSSGKAPMALELNDDTLLESIEFTKRQPDAVDDSHLTPELSGLQPDEQPQLQPLDQITLLTEATIKDTFSPLDKLNSEEILPYAVRVLSDKPTNWQIFTQALLVRSRIESHRSRTQERSVLQLQSIVDQIVADTQEAAASSPDGVPEIRITQFLPRAKSAESAPVADRLKYIYQLNTPTRWEVETELAYAWSKAGSLVSALQIFKRLQLWAEVALCYHSVNQEGKARQIVRRQLYYSSKGEEMDKYDIDADEVVTEKWDGEVRFPPPAHSPRLWCILGDLDQDPTCWLRAWEISKHRYARAQRTLGDYYTRKGDLEGAREAYMKATVVNRQNNDTWSRLGDIDLRVGNWDGAIIAFQQSIMIDDSDAKTYSNLGSALLSKHAEMISLQKVAVQDEEAPGETRQSPKDILRQALIAYKRGAAIAHNNWKIWDNVITIAGRMIPPSFPELLMGMRAVIRIRAPTVGELAVDIDVLRALIAEVTSQDRLRNTNPEDSQGHIYTPPRGSLARATIEMVENEIVPLITKRVELWALVEKLKLYRRDYAGALASAEKSWRIASSGEEWLLEKDAWRQLVAATDNLVSAFENYGPRDGEDGTEVEKAWKMKARSAVRGVMGKAKDVWDGTDEWEVLKARLEELKS